MYFNIIHTLYLEMPNFIGHHTALETSFCQNKEVEEEELFRKQEYVKETKAASPYILCLFLINDVKYDPVDAL